MSIKEIEQKIIQSKKEYKKAYSDGAFENKASNLELWEDSIMDMEEYYKNQCDLNNIKYNDAVLEW